jgi:hypothetical protein
MKPSGHTRKLAELRAKTDRQLANYLSEQLDRALVLAEAGESLGFAEKVYAEVQRLFPLATTGNECQWRSFLSRLNRLRHLLDVHTVISFVA